MKEIICISGDLSSGKSVVGRLLAEKLGYEYYSAGAVFRLLAGKMGLSVMDFNKLSETDRSIDSLIDSEITQIGEIKNRIVLDSRMAWYFIRDSFKVYMTIDGELAASRVLQDMRGETEKYSSIEEARVTLKARKETETRRYLGKYGVNIGDLKNYHMVVDTTRLSPEEVADAIIEGYSSYLAKKCE